MAKLAISLQDNAEGNVDISTYGELDDNTPASRLLWAALYIISNPIVQSLLRHNISLFREATLRDEQVDSTTDLG